MIHLWAKHRYYCADGCYFAKRSECHIDYETWEDFIAEQGDADWDYNLLYRFDWMAKDEEKESYEPVDLDTRDGVLKLYFMGQRKAYPRSVHVQVCAGDEDKVRAYITPRFEFLKSLWAPLEGSDCENRQPWETDFDG